MCLSLSESFPRVIWSWANKKGQSMGSLDPSVILFAVFSVGILGVFGAVVAVRYL
jgi:hypothetical protein